LQKCWLFAIMMMMKKIPSYAKINLGLKVSGKHEGLHILDMVSTSISLCDDVNISFNDSGTITTNFSDRSIDDNNNTVTKACQLVREHVVFGADIFIKKNIPMEAGLGGGSGNAATVLNVLEEKFELSNRGVNLLRIAKQVGSDVPSMLTNGFKRVGGTGEEVEKIESNMKLNLLLVKGKKGVSTRECFGKYATHNEQCTMIDNLILAIKTNDLNSLIQNIHNDLTAPAIFLVPEISDHIELIKKHGSIISFMTGSGSTCVGIFETMGIAMQAEKEISKLGLWAKACFTTL